MISGFPSARKVLKRYSDNIARKSLAVTQFLTRHIASICIGWLIVVTILSAIRLSFPAAPVHGLEDITYDLLGYGLVIIAPAAGYLVAKTASGSKAMNAPTSFRWAILGRWRQLTPEVARTRPAFGPIGFMASLLVGLLLNVVIRTLEFFVAVPAMGAHAPAWGRAMFALMAMDLVVTSFFYLATFVLALRTIPLFPRMLGFVWMLDITLQLFIARQLGSIEGMPPQVAESLGVLLEGNIHKVLISVLIWLPYLLLSERVNVTYRHRDPAEGE